MFIKTERKTNTLANGETKEYTNIKIVDNIRVDKKTKHITIETFGSLEKQENKEEFMEMVRNRLLELKEERKQTLVLKINKEDNHMASSVNIDKNYGYKILESIYDYLELDKYFDDYQDKLETKIQFKLSKIFKFIVIERILNQDIKGSHDPILKTLYGVEYNFNLDNIYDSLDYYAKVFDDVQIHIRERINTLIENSSDKVYYD
jgi:ribosomal protein S10